VWILTAQKLTLFSLLQYSQLSPDSVWALSWTQCSALYAVAAFLELSYSADGDVICNMSYIYGHGLCLQRTKTEQNGGLVWLSLTMDLHRIWRKTHLSKPKWNYTRNCIFSACAFVYHEICLSLREPVRGLHFLKLFIFFENFYSARYIFPCHLPSEWNICVSHAW